VSVRHRIVSEEQELLDQVRTLLDEEPYIVPPSEADIVEELVRLREEMPTAKAEDLGSLMQQYNQSHALLGQLRESRDKPDVDPDSPYFAHLRLKEAGRKRDVFLGKATRIQRGVRIVDWRNAPISRIFYAYQQGEEYEEELGGRVQMGEVEARRTVTILRGELERIDAPEGTFRRDSSVEGGWKHLEPEALRLAGGQGSALRAYQAGEGTERRLGTDLEGSRRRADKRLPDIAGLIDADQFDLITKPSSGFVVIRGTAGSGKTTVALHRIAYLAFEDPLIDSPRTLFLVFSVALREYVSHVLPALGVENAQVRDYRHWAAEQRQRHFSGLPRRIRNDTPADVSRLKLHPAMLQVLEAQVERVDAPANAEQAIDDWMSALTNLDLLTEVFSRADPDAFTASELQKITTWCRDRHEEIIARMDGDDEVLAALDEEDDPLLLRAWQLRVGPLRGRNKQPLRYRHVAIDEVQDFSPLEVRVLLGCLDERKSITLAGDTQQHVMQDAGFTSWSAFFAHLGLEGTAVNTLRVSYRSSQQVVELAMKLLGDLREDDTPPLVTRTGPPVELFRFTDHGAAVAFLADALKELLEDEPLASVVLLTPDAGISGTYYAGLDRGEVPRLRRITEHDFTFAPGVEITEIDKVKGLEFDYVIVVEVNAFAYPDTPGARRLLHVAATRAVHQLWFTSVGTPSPIIREAMGR
jgi:DNA helicase-2/ATP-dependent DNA helicase PcrA